ncbi:MAG: sigma 54-interacting transcriptional regulator [Desulfovibrionaceae bacterium]
MKNEPPKLIFRVAKTLAPVSLMILLGCLAGLQCWFSNQREQQRKEEVAARAEQTARNLEQLFETCRQDLLLTEPVSANLQGLASRLSRLRCVRGFPYRALLWIPDNPKQPVLVAEEKDSFEFPLTELDPMLQDQLAAFRKRLAGSPGDAALLGFGGHGPTKALPASTPTVILFGLRRDDTASGAGTLALSLDARMARNALGLLPRGEGRFLPEDDSRVAWFADADGWIMFQSGRANQTLGPLETYLARTGLKGTLGRPGHPRAFRPSESHLEFWRVIANLRTQDLAAMHGFPIAWPSLEGRTAYAPVQLKDADGLLANVGIVVATDRNPVTLVAETLPLAILLAVMWASMLLLSLALVHQLAAKPFSDLSKSVSTIDPPVPADTVPIPQSCREARQLGQALQTLLARMERQDLACGLNAEMLMAPADIAEPARDDDLPEIIGHAPKLQALKMDIRKAAAASADVLITGETGVGKQLVAEALHRLSSRGSGPLISVNCGALDQNLLLDVLFGHVPGAFTQAINSRKGAFVEADGGSLFLDEIQTSSPHVQQALLRALAERRIRPLGGDEEIEVDVRIIAASNVELPSLMRFGAFREDLFYRLNVLHVRVMPLREHKESLPILAAHYLRQAEDIVGRGPLRLSHGGLQKLLAYDWPGNIRELVNCVTRAAVMAESNVIQAHEIKLDDEAPSYFLAPASDILPGDAPSDAVAFRPKDVNSEQPRNQQRQPQSKPPPSTEAFFNPRQRKALPEITRRKVISRKDYQEIIGGHLPTRTALHDLQDMVNRGVLTRKGRGPAIRYEITENKPRLSAWSKEQT